MSVMLPFIDARPALPKPTDDNLDADEIARLRELSPVYARPIDDDADVYRLIAEATRIRELLESPSAVIGARALGAAIARRVRILEQAEDELGIAIRMLDR